MGKTRRQIVETFGLTADHSHRSDERWNIFNLNKSTRFLSKLLRLKLKDFSFIIGIG